MTKKSILFFVCATIITTVFIGCNKATVDTTAPVITITSPTEGDSIMQMTSNDSSTVSVHITDEDLHAYSILITKTDGSDTLLYVPETHQEVNDLTVSKKFPLPVVVGKINYKIIVGAEDHSGNKGEATRNFSVKHM